tara:strand:- start:1546 stop:2118 length:573 start_codon:yes stop_codon:yes gene_type:complete
MEPESIDKQLINHVIENSHKHQIKFIKIAEKIIFGALSKFHQIDESQKKDLAQSIFLKLFEKDKRRIRMWNARSKFSTYLYMITSNHAIDFLGSKYVAQTKANKSNIDVQSVNVYDKSNSEDNLIDKMTLDMCKEKLRPIEKDIIELYYNKGYKEKDISEKLKISINTISSIKSRALKKLRKNVVQEYWV